MGSSESEEEIGIVREAIGSGSCIISCQRVQQKVYG
jgi:hypothetical protein